MSEILLETKALTKTYGRHNAVDNINLRIRKGSIYGLIGKNGAGKTTLMRILSGMCKPTSGTFEYTGYKGGNNEAFGRTGSLIEMPALMPGLDAYDNLKLKSIAYGCFDDSVIRETLKLVGLERTQGKKVKGFSLGMRQRLGIALALIGDPDILFLDEPINGLDPEGIAEVREILTDLNRERGITIIISSHILAELSKLATDYAFIDNGRIIEETNREELEAKNRGRLVFVCDDTRKACEILRMSGHNNIEVADDKTIYIYEDGDPAPEINMMLCKEDVLVRSFDYESEDLERYFLDVVRKASGKGVV